MWGANAVNGVINILSKDARETQGTLVMGGGGTEARGFGGVRHGGKLGESTFYRAYAKYRDFDQKVFADGSGAHDGLWQAQTGFRIDSFLHGQNELTFQGDIYRGEFELLNRDSAKNSGGNLLSRWTHRFSGESELRVQAYFDRSSRDVPLQFEEDRDTWDLDVQHRFAMGERHDLIWGLEHKVSADDTARDGTVQFDPDHRTIQMASAFAQDEIALVPERLGLTLGSKFEHNDFTGFEIQPSIRLAYTPTRRQTWWAAISRAVRTPTRAEDDIRFIPVPSNGRVLIRGDRGFESEEVLAYELGYRVQPHARLSLDLAVFHNEYDNLRSQEPTPGTIIPLVIRNEREGETYGGEVVAAFQASEWWRITGSYTYLQSHFRNKPGSLDTSSAGIEHNDPRQIVTLRSAMDLPHHLEFDWMIRYVDMLPNPRVPSYLVLDLRLGWEARPGLEIIVGAQNLLDDRHPEFGAAAPNRSEVEHSVYGKVTCRF
jgi:iron complex outermembrane receptor protein